MSEVTSKTNFAKDQLKAIIERIERLEEEKKATSDDIRDVYAEAKGNGFDVKAVRSIIRIRKIDPDERREQEEILDTYMNALGMLPLFEAAERRAKEIDETKVEIRTQDRSVTTTIGTMKKASKKLTRADRKKLQDKFPLMAR